MVRSFQTSLQTRKCKEKTVCRSCRCLRFSNWKKVSFLFSPWSGNFAQSQGTCCCCCCCFWSDERQPQCVVSHRKHQNGNILSPMRCFLESLAFKPNISSYILHTVCFLFLYYYCREFVEISGHALVYNFRAVTSHFDLCIGLSLTVFLFLCSCLLSLLAQVCNRDTRDTSGNSPVMDWYPVQERAVAVLRDARRRFKAPALWAHVQVCTFTS